MGRCHHGGVVRMTHTLHLDIESFSTIDLTETGVHVYAEHPTTEIHCVSYAIDDGPAHTWKRGWHDHKVPIDVSIAVKEGWEIVAHNSAFERTMWRHILTPRYGWPSPKLSQWRCTMVQALAMALPASLKNATRAVGIDDGGKADDGRALMLQMCKPRRARKGEPDGVYWHHTDKDGQERLDRLYRVCEKDVEDERELDKRTLRLTPAEFSLWHLDQKINDRGVFVDQTLCEAALKIVDQAERWLNEEIRDLTAGEVGAFTNVAQIARWCRLQGVPTESLTRDAVEDLLARKDLSPVVRRVLEIRLEGAKAAVKKLNALMRGRSTNGRARGLLQFHAAGTGRWAGRRFQPQNIKRPEIDDVDGAIEAIAGGDADFVRLTFGEPLAVVSHCIR